MDETIIKVDHVSKDFKLPHEKVGSIKNLFINAIRYIRKSRTYETQHALKDISFEVKKGEFFGIVGRNGSGKSTLLKMLAGIYRPTGGDIHVGGKIVPFIELGVGFNPELTGRENVFLNGALLGFSRKEVEGMYQDIVDFAEIEKFMDQKLRNYSSGMQVRLAFSIAIRAKSDILILDEVLAVGDEAFQKKCIDIFENYKSTKQTIVLVTHDMGTVKRFCNRAILIDDGRIVSEGSPNKVANEYTELNNQVINRIVAAEDEHRLRRNKTKVKLSKGNVFAYDDKLTLKLDWSDCEENVQNVGVAVYGNSGEYVFGANTLLDKVSLLGRTTVDYNINARLGPGNYHFKIGVFGETDKDTIEFIDEGPNFIIKQDPKLKWQGITSLEHDWGV